MEPRSCDETPQEWDKRARLKWDRVFFPERRFEIPWGDDELLASVQSAWDWLVRHPAPDEQLAQDIDALLDAYSEMTTATVPRLQELRKIIDHHNKAILE